MTRIVIADDHALFRQGLRTLLAVSGEVSVVGDIARADDVRSMLSGLTYDVLLLDLQMGRSMLPDLAELARAGPVIVVTASESVSDVREAVAAGARGIVFKRFAIETLVEAIRAVVGGGMWLPPELQTLLLGDDGNGTSPRLSQREREVVRYVALGLRNAEVARRISVTEGTVKTHLNNVFHKLGLRDRVQLTLYAIRHRLIRTDEDAD